MFKRYSKKFCILKIDLSLYRKQSIQEQARLNQLRSLPGYRGLKSDGIIIMIIRLKILIILRYKNKLILDDKTRLVDVLGTYIIIADNLHGSADASTVVQYGLRFLTPTLAVALCEDHRPKNRFCGKEYLSYHFKTYYSIKNY